LVAEFNLFLNTDIKFVKGEVMKHLFSKIQLPGDLNSREGYIRMVPITAITVVKFTEADDMSPLFCEKGGYNPKKINGTGETGAWLHFTYNISFESQDIAHLSQLFLKKELSFF
jgi:hypothetical protein